MIDHCPCRGRAEAATARTVAGLDVLVSARVWRAVGALSITFVSGHEVELNAAVLFYAGTDGPFHDGCGEPAPQGKRVAAEVTG